MLPLGTPYLYVEGNNEFIREPFIACFKAGNFDFTLVEIHVIYGDTISDRRAEVSLLDDVILAVKTANARENDIILVGDFNLESDDLAWQMNAIGYQPLVDPTQKTTITDTSSYDNIWINPSFTQEFESFNEIYRFDEVMFNNDDNTAELAVSDQRPVSAVFKTDLPDDDTGNGCGNPNNPPGTQGTLDVRIYSVTASPTDSEQVTLKNYSSFTTDISHWTIGDKNNPTAYTIPYNTYLAPGETITFKHSTLGFGINDSGEIIYLKDTNGNTIDTWSN